MTQTKAQIGDTVRSLIDYRSIEKDKEYEVAYYGFTLRGVHVKIGPERDQTGFLQEHEYEIVSSTPTVSELGEMMGMDPLKELNNLTTHPTGAVREPKEGKGKQHYLLVGFPYTLTELAKHMENPLGRNWEQGLPVSSYADAALRHLIGYLSGDPEPHHMRAAIWNMMCMSETVHRVEIGTLPKEVDDVNRERRSWMNGEVK